jgi:hypothetical protein
MQTTRALGVRRTGVMLLACRVSNIGSSHDSHLVTPPSL